MTYPSNFSHHIINEAKITLFIEEEGQWYELLQYDYTIEGLVISNLEINRSYILQITLSDNSSGQSLVIRPKVELDIKTSNYPLLSFTVLLFFLILSRRN